MALDLYLVVVTANNVQLVGTGTPKGLKNPFRNDAAVSRPLVVSDFDFGGDLPITAGSGGGGGGTAKVVLTELTVTLPDDSVTPTLFAAMCLGTRYTSVDVLAVTTGDTPRVVSGVGLATGVLVSALDRSVTTDGVVLKLAFDAQLFSVGSAPQRPDGSYSAFTYVTFDRARNVIT